MIAQCVRRTLHVSGWRAFVTSGDDFGGLNVRTIADNRSQAAAMREAIGLSAR